MTVQMWFAGGDADVAPGATTVLALIVVNVGEETETFRLSVAGLAAPWTTIQPATITVPAGSQDEVAVEVHPPRVPSTTAGSSVMTVRAIAQDRADVAAETSIALTVTPDHDRRLTLLQPAQRSRSWATFEMTLENRGNSHASCRMRLLDPSARVGADFSPPAVGLDPGETALIRAKVRANERRWERRPRTLAFRVEAEQQGLPAATDAGSLVQLPMLPDQLIGSIVALLLAVAVVVAGWFGIVKPAIRDAADDAVRNRVDAEVVAPTTLPSAATTPSGSTVPPATDSTGATIAGTPTTAGAPTTSTAATTTTAVAGVATSQRLSVAVPAGQTQTANYVVAAGSLLRVTDVVLQNPAFDKGTATLSRNDQVLLEWGIDTMLFVPNSYVTPIEVAAGEQLVFTLTCTAVGAAASATGTCSAAVLISGRTAPSAS